MSHIFPLLLRTKVIVAEFDDASREALICLNQKWTHFPRGAIKD